MNYRWASAFVLGGIGRGRATRSEDLATPSLRRFAFSKLLRGKYLSGQVSDTMLLVFKVLTLAFSTHSLQ